MNEWAWVYACWCMARTLGREQGPAAPGDPPSDDLEVTRHARHLQFNTCVKRTLANTTKQDVAYKEAIICA
jgi:hypothetical protein